jgi:precorrin-3B synthase
MSRQGDEGRRGHSALGTFPLSNSTNALGVALPFGSMPAGKLAGLAREAAGLGAADFRPAPGRRLLVTGLNANSALALQRRAAALGFVTDPTDPRLFVAACPGKPACAAGRIETRAIAEHAARHGGALLDGSFTLHVSGCVKGCAHPAPAMLTLTAGENGAGLVVDGTAGAAPAGYIAADRAARALDRVAALVAKERGLGETAAACLARLGPAAIATAFAQEQA